MALYFYCVEYKITDHSFDITYSHNGSGVIETTIHNTDDFYKVRDELFEKIISRYSRNMHVQEVKLLAFNKI